VNHTTANPLLYLPGVYFWNGKLYHGSTNEQVFEKLQNEYVPTLARMWCVWIPANIVMFTLVPTPLQVPYISVVNFGWNTMLSPVYYKEKEKPAD